MYFSGPDLSSAGRFEFHVLGEHIDPDRNGESNTLPIVEKTFDEIKTLEN